MANVFVGGLDPVTGLPKRQPGLGLGGQLGDTIVGSYGRYSPSSVMAAPFTPYRSEAGGNAYVGPGSAGGGGNGPGAPTIQPFDYKSAIENDPVYRQMVSDLGAQGVSDRAGLTAARQRAIAQFGVVPDVSGLDQSLVGPGFAEDLTPEVRALAAQNTAAGLSTQARLNQAHDQQRQALIHTLASTGRLHSGEAGYQLGLDQQQFAQGQYDANQKLLDVLGQYAAGFAEAQRQQELARQQAAAEAAQRQLELQMLKAQAYQWPSAPPPPGAPPQPPQQPVPPPPAVPVTYALPKPVYTMPGGRKVYESSPGGRGGV